MRWWLARTVDAIAQEYELNVGRFIREHPEWIIAAGFEGVGYRARRRDGGSWVSALTLDELAAAMLEDTRPAGR